MLVSSAYVVRLHLWRANGRSLVTIKKEVVLSKIPVEHHNQYLSNQSMHHLPYRTDVCFLDRIGTINIRGHQCRISSCKKNLITYRVK